MSDRICYLSEQPVLSPTILLPVLSACNGHWIPNCEEYQNIQHLWSIHSPFHIHSLPQFFRIGHFHSFYSLDDKHNGIRYLTRQNNQMIQCRDYRHKYCLYYQFHQQHKLNHIDQNRGAADICSLFERLPIAGCRTIL